MRIHNVIHVCTYTDTYCTTIRTLSQLYHNTYIGPRKISTLELLVFGIRNFGVCMRFCAKKKKKTKTDSEQGDLLDYSSGYICINREIIKFIFIFLSKFFFLSFSR